MLDLSIIFCLPLIILLSMETLMRDSLGGALWWLIIYYKQSLLNYAMIFGIVNIFYFLPKRIYILFSSLFLISFSVAAFISRAKIEYRGEPLLPMDILLKNEVLDISHYFDQIFSLELLLTAVLVIIVIAVLRILPQKNIKNNRRLMVAVFSMGVIFLSFYHFKDIKEILSIRQINWDQKWNYRENGTVLGFTLNWQALSIKEPDNYNQKIIGEIIEDSKVGYKPISDFKPNVIFILSEAFWDPTNLKEVEFSRDPIPFFHSLQNSYTSGDMLVPVYGGGTVATEFEVLTSFSTSFLPSGVMPYVSYIYKPVESLASIFAADGYQSTAIHTYHNWFYRRNKVYQYLGFDKFISAEFLADPEYGGQYIRDIELTRTIIDELKNSDCSDFIFAVSMQGHGPYALDETETRPVKTESSLSEEATAILESYAGILTDVDYSLRILIEGLKRIDEPSIVVFFGDHLPMLGEDYQVYREADYYKDDNTYENYQRVHTAPFVIWDNFSDDNQELNLSATYLGPYVLRKANIEGSVLTDYLNYLYNQGITSIPLKEDLHADTFSGNLMEKYSLLQYDLLFGREYTYKLQPQHQPHKNKEFLLGSKPAEITKIEPIEISTAEQGEIILKVYGNNIASYNICINGIQMETSRHGNYLSTELAEEFYRQPGLLEINVQLIDSMDNIISKSNKLFLKVTN